MIARLPRLVAVLLPLLGVALLGCTASGPSHPAVGRIMTALPIVSLSDPTAAPPSLVGRITLLNFWGTWCPPCRKELPGLVRLATRLSDEPAFQFIAVSCGSGWSDDGADLARETREYLASRQMPLEAWGFGDAVGTVIFTEAYALEAFPTTYLIGPDARVRRVWTGYRSSDEADMAAAILALLKESAGRVTDGTPSPETP